MLSYNLYKNIYENIWKAVFYELDATWAKLYMVHGGILLIYTLVIF